MARHELTEAEWQVVLAYRAMQEAKATVVKAEAEAEAKRKNKVAAEAAYERAATDLHKVMS